MKNLLTSHCRSTKLLLFLSSQFQVCHLITCFSFFYFFLLFLFLFHFLLFPLFSLFFPPWISMHILKLVVWWEVKNYVNCTIVINYLFIIMYKLYIYYWYYNYYIISSNSKTVHWYWSVSKYIVLLVKPAQSSKQNWLP